MRACKTPLALPCVAALSGKGLAFTSAPGLRALAEPAGSGLVFTREAPLWLGVRAAMSAPAWVTPASWMDVPLIAAQEPEACALALRALGAQELLFVVPVYQPDGRPDAFTRCARRGCAVGAAGDGMRTGGLRLRGAGAGRTADGLGRERRAHTALSSAPLNQPMG